MLSDLADAAQGFILRQRVATVRKRHQRRSVGMTFDDDEFHVDLVPAVAPDGAYGTLLVPDRKAERWIKSAPLAYGKHFTHLNAKTDGKLLHLVLLMRHWALLHCGKGTKGFWIEALLIELCERGKIVFGSRPLLEIAADAFDAMHAFAKPAYDAGKVLVVPDPVLGGNVAGLWERTAFEHFGARLTRTCKVIAKAAREKEENAAVTLWQEIFGPRYLAPEPEWIWRTKEIASVVGVGLAAVTIVATLGRTRQ
ncbi:MAG: SMODS domain-containing nucleotidyltransferase [Candidatus Limnocylindria bacterium]